MEIFSSAKLPIKTIITSRINNYSSGKDVLQIKIVIKNDEGFSAMPFPEEEIVLHLDLKECQQMLEMIDPSKSAKPVSA